MSKAWLSSHYLPTPKSIPVLYREAFQASFVRGGGEVEERSQGPAYLMNRDGLGKPQRKQPVVEESGKRTQELQTVAGNKSHQSPKRFCEN